MRPTLWAHCAAMPKPRLPRDDADAGAETLVAEGDRQSLRLLQANLVPQGILAARPGEAADARRYTRIFGRDAAICVLAMSAAACAALEQGAVASLDALAAQQAPNGQIPKYVDPQGQRCRLLVPRLHRRHAVVADRRGPVRRLARCTHALALAATTFSARIQLAAGAGAPALLGCCSRTRPATGPTSCRARASCCTPTRCGTT